jgi:hypothetical protein
MRYTMRLEKNRLAVLVVVFVLLVSSVAVLAEQYYFEDDVTLEWVEPIRMALLLDPNFLSNVIGSITATVDPSEGSVEAFKIRVVADKFAPLANRRLVLNKNAWSREFLMAVELDDSGDALISAVDRQLFVTIAVSAAKVALTSEITRLQGLVDASYIIPDDLGSTHGVEGEEEITP